MTMTNTNDDAWDVDWDAQRRRKFTIGLAATPAERLDWLEEMIELAHATGALPRRRPDPNRGWSHAGPMAICADAIE
jgi:hypothetical protein